MFQTGDVVLYNRTDIYKIQERRTMPFLGRETMDFYVLKPLFEDTPGNQTVYVPVDADPSRLRAAYTADEVRALLASGGTKVAWVDNAMMRKKTFGDLMQKGEPEELLGLIRALVDRRARKARGGQRFSDADERTLMSAEKQLYPMFRHALGMEWNAFLVTLGDEAGLSRPGSA